jgi:hypothetical protein
MNQPIRVPGHSDPSAGAPHDERGQRLTDDDRRGGFGHARCTCGEISTQALPSQMARQRWHRRHREELAGVPWG